MWHSFHRRGSERPLTSRLSDGEDPCAGAYRPVMTLVADEALALLPERAPHTVWVRARVWRQRWRPAVTCVCRIAPGPGPLEPGEAERLWRALTGSGVLSTDPPPRWLEELPGDGLDEVVWSEGGDEELRTTARDRVRWSDLEATLGAPLIPTRATGGAALHTELAASTARRVAVEDRTPEAFEIPGQDPWHGPHAPNTHRTGGE